MTNSEEHSRREEDAASSRSLPAARSSSQGTNRKIVHIGDDARTDIFASQSDDEDTEVDVLFPAFSVIQELLREERPTDEALSNEVLDGKLNEVLRRSSLLAERRELQRRQHELALERARLAEQWELAAEEMERARRVQEEVSQTEQFLNVRLEATRRIEQENAAERDRLEGVAKEQAGSLREERKNAERMLHEARRSEQIADARLDEARLTEKENEAERLRLEHLAKELGDRRPDTYEGRPGLVGRTRRAAVVWATGAVAAAAGGALLVALAHGYVAFGTALVASLPLTIALMKLAHFNGRRAHHAGRKSVQVGQTSRPVASQGNETGRKQRHLGRTKAAARPGGVAVTGTAKSRRGAKQGAVGATQESEVDVSDV